MCGNWQPGSWPGKETERFEMDGEETAGMQGENDHRQRLRELASKLSAEEDHDTFTSLVKEFNELLDGERPQYKRPATRPPDV